MVDHTLAVAEDRSTLFFLGAGASAPSPSCLPQAWQIQRAVYELVAPAGAEDRERDLIIGSLPEIYHEVLLEIGGQAAREIWRVLSFWEQPDEAPELAGFHLGPNLVHLLVVYLSWKCRRPVITVNFDQMLERAAEDLGLTPDVGLDTRSSGSSVAIWKLHGSVSEPASIRTTLQGITAIDPAVHYRMAREFESSSGCLIGYSGQDIDIFPFLCGWRLPSPIHWLTLGVADTAITRAPGLFIGVEANADCWARQVISRLPEEDPIATRLKKFLDRPVPPRDVVCAVYEEDLRRQARQVFAGLFPADDPKRLLVQAMTLAAVGDNAGADRWADRFLAHRGAKRAQVCRAHLLKSAMAHEFARYHESKKQAMAAKPLARQSQLDAEAAEGKIRVAQANRMLFMVPRLPCVSVRELIGWRSVAVGAEMVFYAVTLRRFGGVGDQGQSAPGHSRIRTQFEYLEHLVRVGSIFQGFAERAVPTAVVKSVLGRYWRYIEDAAYRAGYAHGIANARKYHYRLDPDFHHDDVMSVLDLYHLAPSPTGTAIHHRDVAERMAADLANGDLDVPRDQQLAGMLREYELALEAAREAGDPSLELKIMFDRKAVAPQLTWGASEISTLLAAIQSPAYARLHDRIVSCLTR